MSSRQYICSVTTGAFGSLSAASRFGVLNHCSFSRVAIAALPSAKRVTVGKSHESSSRCQCRIHQQDAADELAKKERHFATLIWATSPSRTAGQQSPLKGCRWGFFMFEQSQWRVHFWHYAGQRTQRSCGEEAAREHLFWGSFKRKFILSPTSVQQETKPLNVTQIFHFHIVSFSLRVQYRRRVVEGWGWGRKGGGVITLLSPTLK